MKPPYRVPSMTEIRKVEPTAGKVVSTFSGAGGSCLGFRMAGFEVAWASEFVDAARETYRANAADTIVDDRDVRDVEATEILDAIGLEAGDLDVLEGSPPCSSFSTSGKRTRGWGRTSKYSDREQRTDDLFFEFVRLLEGLKPRAFVAENVAGLIKGSAKGYFKEILAALRAAGYRVSARVLDAQWLGVPQRRKRLIFVGAREDLDRDPAFPAPLPYRYSLREAAPTVTAHAGASVDVTRFAIGREAERLARNEVSRKYLNLIRADPNRPSPTVTQSGGNLGAAAVVLNEAGPRKFTIDELKRVCAFPDDFVVTGTYEQQWERLGRSVPPVMMKAIADVVRDEVLA